MSDSAEQFVALDKSIAETVEQAQNDLRIIARTQDLLSIDGPAYDYCPEKARQQATLDVLGTHPKSNR